MTITERNETYTIVSNGELYNTEEVRASLKEKGTRNIVVNLFFIS